MAFAVDDFRDLLRLLEEHPEWRAELRRHVLTAELVELPALVRQLAEQVAALAEAQARTDRRLEALVEAQARTERRIEELAEAQARTERRIEELAGALAQLAEAQARTERRVEQLAVEVGGLKGEVGNLRGEVLEHRYRIRAPAYFAPIARRLRVVDSATLADRLEAAVEAQQISPPEQRAILAADLVLTGRRREDQVEVYLLVEVSATIGPYDVERAAERAAVLEKLGRPVVPVVAGDWINPSAAEMARSRGVWRVLDGQVRPPGEP